MVTEVVVVYARYYKLYSLLLITSAPGCLLFSILFLIFSSSCNCQTNRRKRAKKKRKRQKGTQKKPDSVLFTRVTEEMRQRLFVNCRIKTRLPHYRTILKQRPIWVSSWWIRRSQKLFIDHLCLWGINLTRERVIKCSHLGNFLNLLLNFLFLLACFSLYYGVTLITSRRIIREKKASGYVLSCDILFDFFLI